MNITEETQEFNQKIKSLPENILVSDKKYKLDAHGLLAGGYRISYGEFDGETFDWNNKLLDLFYEVGNKPEHKPFPKELLGASILMDTTIYVNSVDEIIADCLSRLNKKGYEQLDEIVTKETMFHRELTSLLNRYSKENGSDTPDFILSNYLISCLRTFDNATKQREKWFGRESKNSLPSNQEV